MKPSDVVIEAEGLTRWFGSRLAVDSLSLVVPRGSVFALLGRNGSGKTTTIRMLLGLTRPSSGTARVLGHDCRALTPPVRARIGYMAEGHPNHEWMSVAQEAHFASQFHERWNEKLFTSIIDAFGVSLETKAGDLSVGQRAGLSMALTLAPEPELLVLDDPALGLDPVARSAVLDTLLRVTRDEGRTVFFASHILEEFRGVIDHVAVLDGSRLRMSGSLDDLTTAVRLYRLSYSPGRMPATLPPIRGLTQERRMAHHIMELTVVHPDADTRSTIASLGAESVDERELTFADAVVSYLGAPTPERVESEHAVMAGGAS